MSRIIDNTNGSKDLSVICNTLKPIENSIRYESSTDTLKFISVTGDEEDIITKLVMRLPKTEGPIVEYTCSTLFMKFTKAAATALAENGLNFQGAADLLKDKSK